VFSVLRALSSITAPKSKKKSKTTSPLYLPLSYHSLCFLMLLANLSGYWYLFHHPEKYPSGFCFFYNACLLATTNSLSSYLPESICISPLSLNENFARH
jgi:hypothetical protein